jgi:hypothetical protein
MIFKWLIVIKGIFTQFLHNVQCALGWFVGSSNDEYWRNLWQEWIW